MTEFKLPELGENVSGGDVTRVLVAVGDTVAREQPVLELETDKATIEVPSSVAGVVTELRIKKGDKLKVGSVVLVVESAASAVGKAVPPPAPVVFTMPPCCAIAARAARTQRGISGIPVAVASRSVASLARANAASSCAVPASPRAATRASTGRTGSSARRRSRFRPDFR